MILRLAHSFRRYFVTISRQDSLNMNKVYFRQSEGDRLNINFLYTNPETGLTRQFNFSRKVTESVESITRRIVTNVDKFIMKKVKKKSKKNSEDDVSSSAQAASIVQFCVNDEVISGEVICESLLNASSNLTLQMNEFKYEVIVNAPWIDALTLPICVLVGFPVYPNKFDAVFTDKKFSEFVWFCGKSASKPQDILWEERARDYTYTPTSADIGQMLKLVCTPGNSLLKGPAMEAITSNCVEAGPGGCPFETRHSFTQSLLSGKNLRVISYNILANLYCDSDFTRAELFPYCSPYALNIDYRKQLLLKEIIGYKGDIVCLQEVDTKVFQYDLVPNLTDEGFKGIFTKKGRQVAEGVACFYRENRFELLENHSIILGEEIKTLPLFSDIWDIISVNEPLVNRFIERATALQAVILKSNENLNDIVVVGNTHLYFHPDSDHIRLLQGGLAIRWLCDKITTLAASNPDKRISLIFCGDFNSVPSCGIYQLYTKGFVPYDHIDWKSNAEEAITGLSLKQDLLLESACGTPLYTNFTVDFSDCLDYIFYTKNSLVVDQVIPLPSEEELREYTALPSVVFPSDHIALIADLRFT